MARTHPITARMYTKMARRSPIYEVRMFVSDRLKCDSKLGLASLLIGRRAILPTMMPEME